METWFKYHSEVRRKGHFEEMALYGNLVQDISVLALQKDEPNFDKSRIWIESV